MNSITPYNINRNNEKNERVPQNVFRLGAGAKSASSSIIRRLSQQTTLATGAYATIDNTGVSGCTEWTSLVALYQSIRVLGLRVWVAPPAGGSYILICTTRNGNNPASTNAALWAGERPVLGNMLDSRPTPFNYEVRPTGMGDFNWQITSSISNFFGVKLFNGNANTLTVFYEFIAEFRANA